MITDQAAAEAAVEALPYFARLRADERLRIASHLRVRRMASGESIDCAADAPLLVTVIAGALTLRRAEAEPIELLAGDWTGELAVLVGHGPAAKLVARDASVATTLDVTALGIVLRDFPTVALPLVADIARELKWTNDLLREVCLASANGLFPERFRGILRRRRHRLRSRRNAPLRHAGALLIRALFVEPRRRLAFWVLLGAILALASARTVVAMILRNGLQKHLFALIGSRVGHPIHIHHFNYGLITVSLVGALSLIPRMRRALRFLALAFGFGLGLIVDEFALLWNLNPDYYQPSSRLAAGAVLFLLAQAVYFPEIYLAIGRRIASWARA